MQVQVEHCAGHLGVEMPVRFRFDARQVEIVENIDQWYGPDYCYFKIKGNDGNLYILRFDEGRAEWELTMFQSPAAHSTHPAPRAAPDAREAEQAARAAAIARWEAEHGLGSAWGTAGMRLQPSRLFEPRQTDRLQSDPGAPEGWGTDRRI
jgi:hypothetical protein